MYICVPTYRNYFIGNNVFSLNYVSMKKSRDMNINVLEIVGYLIIIY